MVNSARVRELVEQRLTDDMFVVDIKVSPDNAISVLIDSDSGVTIGQCVDVSRNVEHSLDREVEDFSLEVSSPGLTESFKVLRQYKKYKGRNIVAINTDGERFSGVLSAVSDDGIKLEVIKKEKTAGRKKKGMATEEIEFSFEQIKSAKCIISFK